MIRKFFESLFMISIISGLALSLFDIFFGSGLNPITVFVPLIIAVVIIFGLVMAEVFRGR